MAGPIDPYEASTVAFLAYLRAEADLSDHRAKTLRAQADQLADLYGIDQDLQERYELGPELAAPLDANGVPKYRGKKRGRKPRERKRKANPNRRKRGHTAYTLFVHERYPVVKNEHPEMQSKEVISVVAKMWAEVPREEREFWKQRALSTADNESVTNADANYGEDDDEEDDDDDDVGGDGDEDDDAENESDSQSGKGGADLSLLDSGAPRSSFTASNEAPVGEDRIEMFNERQPSTRRRRR